MDPQIHLKMVSSHSKGNTALNIVDFVKLVREVNIVSTYGTGDIVLKLEDLTVPPWSVASLVILNSLVSEDMVDKVGMLDSLSYKTKIYQLITQFHILSVFLFDKVYCNHQAQHKFRWGTDVGHLTMIFIKAVTSKESQIARLPNTAQKAAVSTSGL